MLISDLKQLTKVGLSLSVVFSSVAGYLLAVETINYTTLILLAVGGFLMVGASNAFNQVIEKDTDALMKRTQNRPLPTGRMSVNVALTIAILFTILGISILYSINAKTALFGAISIFLYTSVYTPLKSVTPLTVFVGAIPGAIPFMLGWVAATNQFSIEAGILFMIQFFWQFPHFWAIGWLQYEEYKKAGFNMLPMNTKDKGAVKQIIFYTVIMILVSIVPVLRVSGEFYIYPLTAVIIALLGIVMLYYGVQLHKSEDNTDARKLMLASVLYITVVQIIYVVDKFLH
jgi:protoheme IX farnesyltransferase